MTVSGSPSLLVAINGNVEEWRGTFTRSEDAPRLPIPYALGAACAQAGFRLRAIDSYARKGAKPATSNVEPFEAVYASDDLTRAMRETDLALLWGWQGVFAVLRQVALPPPRRRVIVYSYIWPHAQIARRKRAVQARVVRAACRQARAVVLMSAEQVADAKASLPPRVPVIHLTVGVDTAFYGKAGGLDDIKAEDRDRVEAFIKRPFAIMPGDELRLNDDALRMVDRTSLNLLRISQYGHKSGLAAFKSEVDRRGLRERILVLERISYRALRFLFQQSVVYAGLVDSTWQPAGWTVACESLASGVPTVLYEGLTSRELRHVGAATRFVRTVAMNDLSSFCRELEQLANAHAARAVTEEARNFARRSLDLEHTGHAFAQRLREAV